MLFGAFLRFAIFSAAWLRSKQFCAVNVLFITDAIAYKQLTSFRELQRSCDLLAGSRPLLS